jgi:hypothetical protein
LRTNNPIFNVFDALVKQNNLNRIRGDEWRLAEIHIQFPKSDTIQTAGFAIPQAAFGKSHALTPVYLLHK